jgi:hypothetical protein
MRIGTRSVEVSYNDFNRKCAAVHELSAKPLTGFVPTLLGMRLA